MILNGISEECTADTIQIFENMLITYKNIFSYKLRRYQRILKTSMFFSKCVDLTLKLSHFENIFQSALYQMCDMLSS